MALDDRERNFEKALGRQLRANASAGLDCPDAETLAAYHERMLSTEEMVSMKSHIAACPSCQEILATLEVTEAIPAETKDLEKAFADKAKGSTVREMPRPKSYIRWVAPAGAIAAGLLIWVAMNGSRSSQKMATPASMPVEVAENPKASQPDAVSTMADQVRESKAKPEEKTLSAENDLNKRIAEQSDKEQKLNSLARSRVSPNAAQPHGPGMMQNQVQNQIQNNGKLNQSESRAFEYTQVTPISPSAVSPQRNAPAAPAAKSQVAAAPSPTPVITAAAGGNAVGGERKDRDKAAADSVEVTASEPAVSTDLKKNEIAKKEADQLAVDGRSVQELQKLDSGVAAEASVTAKKEKQAAESGRAQLTKTDTGFAVGAMASAALRDADEFRLSVVRTTNAKVFWVISKEGEVFRSEDGGKSSRKQEIPAGIKAIAGSATDAKVCWILAEKSIAVRTADGGKHWASVSVPTSWVLTTIKAQDAMHAVVSDASGKIGYSTADGGSTWNLVAQ